MIDLGFLRGNTIAVLGLGKSGLATVRALVAGGADVVAWDDAAAPRRAAAELGARIERLDEADDVHGAKRLILSPGIPRSYPRPHPAVARAEAAGCPIEIDVDLLAEAQPNARYLGITGTNGKSTTTALVGHILQAAGVKAGVGGNLGPPVLALDPLADDGWYVLELSSYQLETVSRAVWTVGVFLNISPDHLDRYPDMMAYVTAKTRLFDTLGEGGTAVIGIDDDWSNAVYYYQTFKRPDRVVSISVGYKGGRAVWVSGGDLIDGLGDAPNPVMALSEAEALPGIHNWQNIAAAYAAARLAGVAGEVAVAAIRSFPGLRHRQERVAQIGGVAFVNDSKATNPDAAARALACYDPIYWIAGGRPKPGGLGVALDALDGVAHAFLIGEAQEAFAAELADRVTTTLCGTLDRAVSEAFTAAGQRPGATVLLSPACASFDQFANFEARGDAFVAAVSALSEPVESAP